MAIHRGFAAGFILTSLASSVRASLSYHLTRLDDQHDEGGVTDVFSLNDSNQAVVNTSAFSPNGSFINGIWQNGKVTPALPDSLGINQKGWVAGNDIGAPAIWKNGHITDLPLPEQYIHDFDAIALNDSGDAVGKGYDTDTRSGSALYWHDGTLQDLGSFDGAQAIATRINDRDQILVYSVSGAREDHVQSFVWRNGTSTRITDARGDDVQASDLNRFGEVVGTRNVAGGTTAFLWEEQMVDLPPLPGDKYTTATGINDRGEVVGTSYSDDESKAHLVVWSGNYSRPVDLLPLVSNLGHWTDLNSVDINNKGVIAGYGNLVNQGEVAWQQRSFILSPHQSPAIVPLPSPAWMGLAIAPLLALETRRRRGKMNG